MSELIVLKLKNDETLAVNSELLTTNSSVFDYLIKELNQTELEFDDFDIEIVSIFITSLKSKTVGNIELNQFRELHKISIAFKVQWLIEKCREYLVNLMDDIANKDYDHVLFLFEEARYIKDKWKTSRYINLLIYKMKIGNNASFIRKYTEHFLHLSENQLDLMLQLAGAGSDTQVLLGMTKQNLENSNTFDYNSRYVLENINLPLAMEQNNNLYHETFDILVSMEDLSHEDTKLILKLHTDSTKQYFSNKQRTRPTTSLIASLADPWWWDGSGFSELRDIEHAIERAIEIASANLPPMRYMYHIVEYIRVLYMCGRSDLLQDSAALVDQLEKESQKKGWKRIDSHHIDYILSATKYWHIGHVGNIENTENIENIENKNIIRDCLEKIRDSEILASYSDSVQAESAIPRRSRTFGEFLNIECIYAFCFQHPDSEKVGITECTLPGRCGFMLKLTKDRVFHPKSYEYKLELCTEESEYPPDLHYHDIVSAENMVPYLSFYGPDKTTFSLPLMYRWGYTIQGHMRWGVAMHHVVKQFHVYYDISTVKP